MLRTPVPSGFHAVPSHLITLCDVSPPTDMPEPAMNKESWCAWIA